MKTESIKKLSSNMEDYLEAIAILKVSKGVARVRDIGKKINVKTPSVTQAISMLTKNDLVVHERYGYVDLTAEGKKLARKIKRRHEALSSFLTDILNISPEIATQDACKMEHNISPDTFERLAKFLDFVKTTSEGKRPEWLRGFDYYFKNNKRHRQSTVRKR